MKVVFLAVMRCILYIQDIQWDSQQMYTLNIANTLMHFVLILIHWFHFVCIDGSPFCFAGNVVGGGYNYYFQHCLYCYYCFHCCCFCLVLIINQVLVDVACIESVVCGNLFAVAADYY